MSLDNKQKQNKLFAFEINAIMKAIRNLAQNIINLNQASHWDYISSGGGSSIAVPASARFVIVNFSWYPSGYSEQHYGQVVLAKEGATSAVHREGKLYTSSGNSNSGVSLSWSGSTLSISSSGGIIATSMSMNAKFYT
ncbi:MAG: hypothetical protein PF572_02295 [Patescibacteria group bacterium]|jgi:hypothetical protein|nr:hypothetical protein [Patescibacteria group bacterium]